MIEPVGLAVAAILALWLAGGVALRALAWIAILSGALLLGIFGDSGGFALVVAGAGVWTVGQVHFAIRHRTWKSPLVEDCVAAIRAAARRG